MNDLTFGQVAGLVASCVAVMWTYAIYCHQFAGWLYGLLMPVRQFLFQ